MIPAPIQTELLERALGEPIGLVIETNNTQQLQILLCNQHRALGLNDLVICVPGIDNTIFIVKKSVELDP